MVAGAAELPQALPLRPFGEGFASLNHSSELFRFASVVPIPKPIAWGPDHIWIITWISVCVLQALLISVLVANLIKLRRTERSLLESQNRLRAILDTAVE